jgi:transposase
MTWMLLAVVDRRSAERARTARQRRVEQFALRQLEPVAWIRRSLVDEPMAAVVDANLLVRQVIHRSFFRRLLST